MAYSCPHCEKDIADAVPKSRFDEIYSERRQFKKELAEALTAAETATATATDSDALQGQIAELQEKLKGQSDSHARALAVMGAGITDVDDAADLLAVFDRRAPEGITVAEWLADPEKLPRAASALLPQPAAPKAPEESNGVGTPPHQPAPQPAPQTDRGAIPHTAAPGAYTPEAIARMSVEEYREARAAIKASAKSA